MIKLNLGNENEYKVGFVNIDSNKNVKADLYWNLNDSIPCNDNSVDYILIEGSIEYIKKDSIFHFIDELWRVCKPNAEIEIYVNHYTSVWAFQHLGHENYFGVDSFSQFSNDRGYYGEKYNNAIFQIEEIKLMFFHHKCIQFPILSKLPINWLFNFSRNWQRAMEKFQVFGFDEIFYRLKVTKP